MAVQREIKRRIKSVNSTRQITKALELVSTAKMRRATENNLHNRPYAERLKAILTRILSESEETVSHPLLSSHEGDASLLIVIASDQGLAGAYDASVIKRTLQFVKEEREAGRNVRAISIGKKAALTLGKLDVPIIQNYPVSSGAIKFEDLHALYAYAIESFSKQRFSKVHLIYTHFVSVISQQTISEQLLPVVPDLEAARLPSTFLYEPSPEDVLATLLPYIIEVQLYHAVLESTASEQSARRIAMKNASDNAKNMIDRLTLTYNTLRQGAITREIAEITSGAAALE